MFFFERFGRVNNDVDSQASWVGVDVEGVFPPLQGGGANEGDGALVEVGFGGFGDEGDREVHDFGEPDVDGGLGGVP